ncbi:MAG: 30S ribosome-binding factor RbfA [Chthoniobacterales bacterium]
MKHRLLRVNEVVKRELSSLIARELTLENVLLTVNDVDVTPDLKKAHVYVSVLGSEGRSGAMAKLEENRATLQALLAKNVVLKYTPQLIFHLDDSVERGSRVIEILEKIEPPVGARKNEEEEL